MTLAQIVTQPATKDQTISIMELALAGGWLMIPIVLSSFVARQDQRARLKRGYYSSENVMQSA